MKITYTFAQKAVLVLATIAMLSIMVVAFTTPNLAKANDEKGSLVVQKVIVGDNSAHPDDFSYKIKKGSPTVYNTNEFPSSGHRTHSLDVGTYTVIESPANGYTTTYSGDCNSSGEVTVVKDQTKTCTVTNTKKPSLIVKKVIVGGSATADQFSFTTDKEGGDPAVTHQFEADGQNDLMGLANGHYAVQEIDVPDNYTVSYHSDEKDHPNDCAHMEVDSGKGPSTCTITNTYVPPAPTTASVNATKVVCTDPADLPTWGAGGPNITATTASEWVEEHNSCRIVPWDFQWAPGSAANPGDNVTGLPSGWTAFVSGLASMGAQNRIWVREGVDTDYIPFTGVGSTDHVSAQMYCSSDVLNYDNYDFISPVVAGNTYYCVAFNSPKVQEPTTGTIEITKYACPADTTVVRSANGVGREVPQGCTPESGVHFGYVHGEQTDANGPYPELDGPFVSGGTTGGNGVLDITNLPSAGRYLVAETNADNQQLPAGDVLGLYCQGDGDTSDHNDNQELTFVPADGTTKCVAYDVAPPTPQTCTVSSDTTTLADGNPSVLTYVHSAWTSIPGASWIWKTLLVDTGLVPDTTTFTKTINLSAVPSGANLTIAADNTYTVLVNGVAPSCDGSQLDNFSASETCPVTNLVAGVNTLTFTVTNTAGSSDPHANPAGLDYSLVIDGASCSDVPPQEQTYLKVHIFKYLWNGETLNPVAADSGAPAFPMSAQWSATIDGGPGSGTYVLGPAGHGGSGPYAADTSQMPAPATYSTHETIDGETVVPSDSETCPAGKYRFVGYKTGDSLSGALAAETTSLDPSFSGILSDKYVIVINEKCPTTSTVTICKVSDAEGHPGLSDWTLMLKGAHVGTVNVTPDGSDHSLASVPAGNYILSASGSYIYRPGDATASTSDAAYSLRLPSDSVYGGPFVPWVRENDFPNPYTGWLGIIFNSAFTDWGSIFHPDHMYATSTVLASTQNMNFKILDDQYGDNSGSMNVDVDQGYVGITGETGCVTFNNVPYGSYTVAELNQPNWTPVSGTGPVTVDAPTENFTVVNHDTNQVPEPSTVQVHIFKFIDGEQATTESANSAAFPMLTTFSSPNLGNYTDAPFTLSPTGWGSTDSAYEASFVGSDPGADYTAHEVTTGNDVVGASCKDGKPFALVGYSVGDTMQEAEEATATTAAPAFTNLTGDKYVIVRNETCPPPVPDVCPNLAGDQATVPAGDVLVNGLCLDAGRSSVTTFSSPSGGGGGSVRGESTTTEPTPQVLGETCGLYMDKYLRIGHSDNDVDQTKKLQDFLNRWMNSNLPITGFFGKLTEKALESFQSKYGDDILKPWGIAKPTGIAYYTTLYKINMLECPSLTLEIPTLVPWSQSKDAH